MRLQLTRAAGAALAVHAACVGAAVAQDGDGAVRVRSALYQDDDATTVVTAAVEANAVVAESVGIRAGYLIDAITTASVDVVTAATERWDERRDEARGGVDVFLGEATVNAGVVRSIENDYDSWTVSLGGSVDLAQRATTLGVGLGWIDSDVGRADDPAFHGDQQTLTATLRAVQVLSPDTLGAVSYALIRVDGLQSSPYRYVRVGDGTAVLERHPTERLRHALTARVRHSLSPSIAFGVDERLYADDWGMIATTTNVVLALSLSETLDLELRNRFHFQRAVSFWQERYDQQRRFVSVDRELSTFLDDYAGPALIWSVRDAGPFDRLRADVRADVFYYRFLDYAYLDGRVGTLVSIGVEGAW